jgi:hypothetical protein
MTIQTTVSPIPDSFPPAKFYLDDLEEIVAILREGVESEEERESKPTTFTFGCAGRKCDTLEEVPRILKPRRELEIEVRRGWRSTKLSWNPWIGNYWSSSSLSNAVALSTHRRLAPIFERRKRRLSASVRTIPMWAWAIVNLAVVPIAHRLAHSYEPTIGSKTADRLEFAGVMVYFAIFLAGAFTHTTLVPRRSHERSGTLTYLTDKIIPLVVGCLLGIAGTLLAQVLSRKIGSGP